MSVKGVRGGVAGQTKSILVEPVVLRVQLKPSVRTRKPKQQKI